VPPLPDWEILAEQDLPAHQQMALDEVLLERVVAGARAPTLRFWGWIEPTLVLGSSQSVANEVDEAAVRRRGFTITRRLSGGGTMLAEPGRTVTWSLYLPAEVVAGMSFRESYAYLDAFAVQALRKLGVDAAYRPINDIVSPAGKIAGAAQARRRGALLHHTTLAYSMAPGLLRELIRIGRPSVATRGVRSAAKVVTPVDTLVPASREELLAALVLEAGGHPGSLEPGELAGAERLAATKYARPEWIYRIS